MKRLIGVMIIVGGAAGCIGHSRGGSAVGGGSGGGGSGGGGSGSWSCDPGFYGSNCLDACQGLPSCCTGTGCICDSEC